MFRPSLLKDDSLSSQFSLSATGQAQATQISAYVALFNCRAFSPPSICILQSLFARRPDQGAAVKNAAHNQALDMEQQDFASAEYPCFGICFLKRVMRVCSLLVGIDFFFRFVQLLGIVVVAMGAVGNFINF